ncbi:CLUMA_CG017254, isoform A [Clunio marinus]|uniref:CLUMA_CG017254, isoform A n=1 Tax=Clunio marinus TaxID=568069 RepID=A0A1J1IVE4_9DIPT|nr:CLUMA_CG017254, isoform A [Clunio marinus]
MKILEMLFFQGTKNIRVKLTIYNDKLHLDGENYFLNILHHNSSEVNCEVYDKVIHVLAII